MNFDSIKNLFLEELSIFDAIEEVNSGKEEAICFGNNECVFVSPCVREMSVVMNCVPPTY